MPNIDTGVDLSGDLPSYYLGREDFESAVQLSKIK